MTFSQWYGHQTFASTISYFPSKLDTISLFKWKMYNYNNKKGKDEEHVSDQRLYTKGFQNFHQCGAWNFEISTKNIFKILKYTII